MPFGSYSSHQATPSVTSLFNSNLTKSKPSRSLNTNFTPSATAWTHVAYTVRVTNTASITVSGTSSNIGRVDLLIAQTPATPPTAPADIDDTTRNSLTLSGTVTISVTLTVTNAVDYTLRGWVPPNHQVNIATTSETGSPTFALIRSTEVAFA